MEKIYPAIKHFDWLLGGPECQETKRLEVEGAWLLVFFLRPLQSLREKDDQRLHSSKMADAGDPHGQGIKLLQGLPKTNASVLRVVMSFYVVSFSFLSS